MSDSIAVDLYLSPAGWPATLDLPALAQALADALADTRRIRVAATHIAEPPPETPLSPTMIVHGEPEQHPVFGPAHRVTIDRFDHGEIVETYTMGAVGSDDPASGVCSAAVDLAYQFADPEFYAELMAAKGHTGNAMHPSVRELDPKSAMLEAIAAVMNADPEPIARLTAKIEHIGELRADAGLWAFASELRALLGDFEAAKIAIRNAHALLPDDEKDAATWRLGGLNVWQRLGHKILFALLLRAGQILATAADSESGASPLIARLQAAGLPGLELDADDWPAFVTASFGDRCGHLLDLGQHLAHLAATTDAPAPDAVEAANQAVIHVVPMLHELVGRDLTDDLRDALAGGNGDVGLTDVADMAARILAIADSHFLDTTA